MYMYTTKIPLAARKAKLITELVAVPDLTLKNHTEFKVLKCR